MTFLSYIAEAPAFVRHNGLNGIENAKAAKLYDVLEYASEKKDLNDLIQAFYDSKK